MSFEQKLLEAIRRNDSFLCVGLDPDPTRIPPRFLGEPDPLFAFNKYVIDVTADLACAYKPNIAFYEAQGVPGLEALKRTIEYIPPHIPVILDAKRGDIGSTAQAYARAVFEILGADAVTVNPYLGQDALKPFLAYREKGVFVLCHTSNPGARDFQTRLVEGRPLYQIVAERAARWGPNVGLVVGATYPEALRAIRGLAPRTWILVPGIGAQGGDVEAVLEAGLDERGQGLIINASRSIIYAPDPRAAALELRERINAARRERPSTPRFAPPHHRLALALHDIGCVRFGDFLLASGKRSPIYIDLRLLASHPALLHQVALVYVDILRTLRFDRIAAMPYAALPIGTAVALEMGVPLIYPRKEVKDYGTGKAVEGDYRRGERVVLLDDLVTTGESKLKAIRHLENEGLVVRDVVVLIDREQGGREYLAEQGYRLHAAMGLRELLDVLVEHGRITSSERARCLTALSSS